MHHQQSRRSSAGVNSKPSLPIVDTSEPLSTDSLTRADDLKERMSIKDRSAQRTYRNRMKLRPEQLDTNPGGRVGSGAEKPDGAPISTVPSGGSTAPGTYVNPASTTDPQGTPQRAATFRQQLHEPLVAESMNAIYLPGQLLADGHVRPEDLSKGLGPSQPERPARDAQQLISIIADLQAQLVDKLNSQHQDAIEKAGQHGQPFANPSQAHLALPVDDPTLMLPGVSQVETQGCFDPTNSDTMDFMQFKNVGSWKQDAATSNMDQIAMDDICSPSQLFFPSTSNMATGDLMCVEPSQAESSSPIRSSSIEERLESVMEQIENVGFDSVDSLATDYYTKSLDKSSASANEQRLSRTRRLPGVFLNVFGAASQWSERERRGLHEAIIQIVESMLITEGNSSTNHASSGDLQSLIESYASNETPLNANSTLLMKRAVENELPNLWILMLALTSSNRFLKSRDRSNVALATTLLLRYAGCMPGERLMSLLRSCLCES